MFVQTHRRPKEHFRMVNTKRGKKKVIVNRGLTYREYVKRRMKDPDIKKLPFLKRLSPIAKEWKKIKSERTHMKGARIFPRYPGEFRKFRPSGPFAGDSESRERREKAEIILKASGALKPDHSLDLDKFFALGKNRMREIIDANVLPAKAKEQLRFARDVIEGSE